jgi:DNA-binding XRE family transcriptional regulator
MPSIGKHCHELRVVDESRTWRIIYRVDADAIIIAEVFAKKQQSTPASVIRASQDRLRRYDSVVWGNGWMDASKRKRLERAGWSVGSTSEFLGLTSVEEELVEMKLALSAKLRKTRESGNLTQTDLAKRMGSSQSRVAKMEAGDPTVSLDLLVQGLLAAGATRQQIASALSPRKKAVGE